MLRPGAVPAAAARRAGGGRLLSLAFGGALLSPSGPAVPPRARAAAAAATASPGPRGPWAGIRVITLDATGTILYHRDPIAQTYAACAEQAGAAAPDVGALRAAFKAAFRASCERWPCYGHAAGMSCRQWWWHTVRATFHGAGAAYGDAEFERVFRRVYQQYGSPHGYYLFEDSVPFLQWASQRYCIGLISNNLDRLVDNTLPMFGLHEYFSFYAISQEVGYEKPGREIFEHARAEASAVTGTPVRPDEILHVGDSHAADYCGARAAGMAAALLSREGIDQYQTWLQGPEYEGKGEEAVQVVASMADVRELLELATGEAAA